MGTPFMAEIKIMSFNFAPKGWATCNGQLIRIDQNQALFALLGTTYGGDGRTTFGLPNLQGRIPLHIGNGLLLGQAGGETAHTLTQQEMPTHIHFLQASSTQGDQATVAGNVLAREVGNIYSANAGNTPVQFTGGVISNVGGSQAHQNMQPYLTLNFCIALVGVFPSRN
jgi:microcystin-dependent protein